MKGNFSELTVSFFPSYISNDSTDFWFDLDIDKRKVTLSINLLEEIEKKEALEKYGAEGSGKNLPFSSLSEDLKKKDKKKD